MPRIGVLPSGHHDDLFAIFAGTDWDVAVFDPGLELTSFRRRIAERIETRTRGGLMVAQILSWIDANDIQAVISLDNNPIVSDLSRFCRVPIFVVQHGIRLTEYSSRPPIRAPSTHLLSWGSLQRDDDVSQRLPVWPNSFHNVRPTSIYPVGSLRDANAARLSFERVAGRKQPSFDLCLISQFKGKKPRELNHWKQRQSAIETLTSWTGRFATGQDLSLVVASYSDKEPLIAQEHEWLRNLLEREFEFCSPRTLTSAYEMTQSSRVTLGVHSSAIWEAFGRRRRVLAVNTVGQTAFDFPLDGIWRLKSTNFSTFERRLSQILELDEPTYQGLLGELPDKVVVAKTEPSIYERIRERILSELN